MKISKAIWSLLGVCIFFIISRHATQAQTTCQVTISADTVVIGDPFEIDVKIKIPQGVIIQGIDFTTWSQISNLSYQNDTIQYERSADIEILNYGKWTQMKGWSVVPVGQIQIETKDGAQYIHNTWKTAIYNAGSFRWSTPDIQAENNTQDIISGESPIIFVSLPASMMQRDSIALNPIKDILKEKATLEDYLIYIYILVGLILALAVGYYFYRLKNKNDAIVDPIPVEIFVPCHIKALQDLKLLDDQKLWQQGLVKEYQSKLTDIIRTYLEGRYHIKALEMTTDEIIVHLRKEDFNPTYETELRYILQIADMVKFAKAKPEEDIHTSFMLKARELVEKTKEVTEQPNMP